MNSAIIIVAIVKRLGFTPRRGAGTKSAHNIILTKINNEVERNRKTEIKQIMAVSEDCKPTIILTQFSSLLLYVHREGRGAQNVHLDFHTAPELSLTQLPKLSLTRIKLGELSLTRI